MRNVFSKTMLHVYRSSRQVFFTLFTPFMLLAAAVTIAQRPTLGNAVRPYVAVDSPVVAIVHARVLDGTGAPARSNQTLIIRDGDIAALGSDGAVQVPADARTVDATGKTVIPGLVMMHEARRAGTDTVPSQSISARGRRARLAALNGEGAVQKISRSVWTGVRRS